MSDVRVVSFDGLRDRLRDVLGSESRLFEAFDEALSSQDDELVARAMDSLNNYPEDTKRMVQDAMLAWLFDGADASGLAAIDTSDQLPN